MQKIRIIAMVAAVMAGAEMRLAAQGVAITNFGDMVAEHERLLAEGRGKLAPPGAAVTVDAVAGDDGIGPGGPVPS